MQYIAFDSHKRYTLTSVESENGKIKTETRIQHEHGAIRQFLSRYEMGTPVAVETLGNWYWIVDEIEQAGMVPCLVHARKAKLMIGSINKTDKLDARGLNRLQRSGTLPIVWIPREELRDKRELTRTRMVLTKERARLKNRIHATLSKYALDIQCFTDKFGKKGRLLMKEQIKQLPEQTRFTTERVWEQLEAVEEQIDLIEKRMWEVFSKTPEFELITSLPGVGFILACIILLEIGDISRFPSASHLASYSGTTPRVHSSGDKTRYGQLRNDVNRYLKWAFVEAANVVNLHRHLFPYRHVNDLYGRIRKRKGHQKAIGAVARHLAEATWWVLSKREPYREPKIHAVSSIRGVSAATT